MFSVFCPAISSKAYEKDPRKSLLEFLNREIESNRRIPSEFFFFFFLSTEFQEGDSETLIGETEFGPITASIIFPVFCECGKKIKA